MFGQSAVNPARKLHDAAVVYLYDGSFEGFLCCVFESFAQHEIPFAVWTPERETATLYPFKDIATDHEKARRVFASLGRKLGAETEYLVTRDFLSGREDKELLLIRFLHLAFALGPGTVKRAGHPDVAPLYEMKKSLDWDELSKEYNQKLHRYMKDLNVLYKKEPALYELDYNPEGFEWINNISADECIVSYVRRAKNGDELLVVVSFTPVLREKYKIGVPKAGHYKEIFNSNAKKYGGTGKLNSRVKVSQESECDNRKDSIYITIPPLGMCIFRRVDEETVTADEIEIPEIVDTKITKSENVPKAEKVKAKKKETPEEINKETQKDPKIEKQKKTKKETQRETKKETQ